MFPRSLEGVKVEGEWRGPCGVGMFSILTVRISPSWFSLVRYYHRGELDKEYRGSPCDCTMISTLKI